MNTRPALSTLSRATAFGLAMLVTIAMMVGVGELAQVEAAAEMALAAVTQAEA